ncbi:hypothetical protein D3C84_878760 [compost metagenome]
MADPLPDGGAGDLGGGRVFHQTVDGHAAVAADPGFQILQGDPDIGAHAGLGALTLAGGQQVGGGDGGILFTQHPDLVPGAGRDGGVEYRHGGIGEAGVSHPGAVVTVVGLPLLVRLDLGEHLLVDERILGGDEGGHATHGQGATLVTGLDQQA